MGEPSTEIGRDVAGAAESRDILDKRYKVHWAPIGKLSKILEQGIFSMDFAKRVGTTDFEHHGSLASSVVHIYGNKGFIYGDPKEIVGILMSDSLKTLGWGDDLDAAKTRVAPRNFIGLVVADDLGGRRLRFSLPNIFAKRDIFSRIDRIKQVLNDSGKSLPIYGNSGDLYWPRRMSHKQIVDAIGTSTK